MRWYVLIALMALVAWSCGSRRSESRVESRNSYEAHDSISETRNDKFSITASTDSVSERQRHTSLIEVNFVDGGGAVEVDSDGRVSLRGVASLTGLKREDKRREERRDSVSAAGEESEQVEEVGDARGGSESVNEKRQAHVPYFIWLDFALLASGVIACFGVMAWYNIRKKK